MALQSYPLLDGVTYSRASAASYFGADGNLYNATSGTPRVDYNPVTRALRGLLVERGSTRLNTHLTVNTSAGYLNDGATLTTLSDNVLGVFPGVSVASTGGTWNRQSTALIAITSGLAYAFTAIVRPGTSGKVSVRARDPVGGTESTAHLTFGGVFSVVATGAGTLTNLTERTLADGVTREITGIWTPNFTGTGSVGVGPYSATVGEDVKFYALQIEQSVAPTSLILGDGAATTRSADLLNVDLSTIGMVNPQALTIFMDFEFEWQQTATASFLRVFEIATYDAGNDRVNTYVQTATGALTAAVNSDNSVQFVSTLASSTAISFSGALAFAVAQNDAAISLNGSAPTTDTSVSMAAPYGRNVLRIGGSTLNATDMGRLWLRPSADHTGLKLYPVRLDNATLQSMTA